MKTIDVPWAQGVLPSHDRAGIWLVNGSRVAPVSDRGEVGEPIELSFVPTAVVGMGSKARAFSDGETIYRPDTRGTFSIRELHLDAEMLGPLAVNYGIIATRVGHHHLLALDAISLRPKWVVDASGRPGYWPYHHSSAPRFGPFLAVTSSGVVAQTDAGVVTVFDAGTGAARLTRRTSQAVWPGPPAVLGDPGQESLVLPAGTGHVVRLDPLDGDSRWETRGTNESGLSGRSPGAKELGGQLFVAVARNHGVEVMPTDADTGQSKWRRPALLSGPRADFEGTDCDGANLYVSNGSTVTAYRLIDGRTIWIKPLSDEWGHVRLVAAVGGLIALPRDPIPDDPARTEFAFGSFIRFPDPRRAFGCFASLSSPWANCHIPIRVFDPHTGATKAAFDVRTAGPGAVIRFSPTGGVVATAGRVYLLK